MRLFSAWSATKSVGLAAALTGLLLSPAPAQSEKAIDTAFAGGPFAPWQAVEVTPFPAVIMIGPKSSALVIKKSQFRKLHKPTLHCHCALLTVSLTVSTSDRLVSLDSALHKTETR